jgi:hypothetical protein
LQGGRTAPEAKLLSKPFHLKDLVMEVDRIFQTWTGKGCQRDISPAEKSRPAGEDDLHPDRLLG